MSHQVVMEEDKVTEQDQDMSDQDVTNDEDSDPDYEPEVSLHICSALITFFVNIMFCSAGLRTGCDL